MCSSLSSQGDEDGIYQAVGSVGPVSICFDVTMGFQLYKKGVYSRYGPLPHLPTPSPITFTLAAEAIQQRPHISHCSALLFGYLIACFSK